MTDEILRRIKEQVERIEVHSVKCVANKTGALKDIDSLIKESGQGRFYCNWCGEMKPIDELAEMVNDKEYVTWSGCRDCHKKKMRL